MAEQTAEKKLLQWHPAFYAGLQIEFAEEANKLIFENEHQLGKKPMGIDVLIIKKKAEEQIRKNIGQIFRRHLLYQRSIFSNTVIVNFGTFRGVKLLAKEFDK